MYEEVPGYKGIDPNEDFVSEELAGSDLFRDIWLQGN